MTDQEIFDKVTLHLLTQGRPALEDGACKYRAKDGSQCAIGCLIEDNRYTLKMENLGIYGLAVRYPARLSNILNSNFKRRDFLSCLQQVHDDCETRSDGSFDLGTLSRRLREVAMSYNLSSAVLHNK